MYYDYRFSNGIIRKSQLPLGHLFLIFGKLVCQLIFYEYILKRLSFRSNIFQTELIQ